VKNFFYFCAALLCLSLAFHFGYSTAKAQAPGNPVVAMTGVAGGGGSFQSTVMTANGDLYGTTNGGASWTLVSNVFSGGPTPTSQQSWGQLKARYAPKSAPTSQPPTDR
jgi:hypothetical protein